MTEFTPAHLEAVVAACRENLVAVAESLNQCFDTKYRLELGSEGAWSPEADSAGFSGSGLMVTIGVGEQGLAVLIPASLPLPDWYTKPGDSENARLQTLPMEWSMNLLPADLEAGRSASVDVTDLWAALKDSTPSDTARMTELLVFSPDGESSSPEVAEAPGNDKADDSSAEPIVEKPAASETPDSAAGAGPAPIAKLLMVWPVTKPLFEKPAGAVESVTSPAAGETTAPGSSSETVGTAPGDPSPMDEFRSRARRIFNLPVVVSVRLAEKRIEMGQLLSITPGSLITFNKSCEELLDLYVNNHKYCRGEAVKIGEKFGMKINVVGVVDVREERVL